jgi:hypothetical protein
LDNWTDEMLDMMINKLIERKKRESDMISGHSSNNISDEQFFKQAGIKVVKNGH